MKKPAIFLDRDGTLIEEVNFLSRIEDLHLFSFTAGAIKILKDSGFLLIVVTNQSGIGRGLYTEAEMHAIHDQIQSELSGAIDGFYYCPHLPGGDCECRKPGIGMIKAAEKDFDIEMAGSWMIGDKHLDVETGHNAQLRSVLVLTGYGQQHRTMLACPPDLISENLGVAATEIIAATLP